MPEYIIIFASSFILLNIFHEKTSFLINLAHFSCCLLCANIGMSKCAHIKHVAGIYAREFLRFRFPYAKYVEAHSEIPCERQTKLFKMCKANMGREHFFRGCLETLHPFKNNNFTLMGISEL